MLILAGSGRGVKALPSPKTAPGTESASGVDSGSERDFDPILLLM